MKKIFYSSITGPDYNRQMGEIMEAECGEEWDGNVAGYLEISDINYAEGPQHIPGDVQQHFPTAPQEICVELGEAGEARAIWWSAEE